jgi:Ca-activated chloride channel homolog
MSVLRKALFVVLCVAFSATTGCSVLYSSGSSSSGSGGAATGPSKTAFRILAGSEVKTIEPVIKAYFTTNGLEAPRIDYLGAVDIATRLGAKTAADIGYDAVWTANPFWIEMGDTGKRVKNVKTIMKSPVVFGVKKSVATKLGWTGKPVLVDTIAKAAADGKLKFVMSSATQSNSGAAAYLGFLHAFNDGKTLTVADLDKRTLQTDARSLLSDVDRSSGSSSWLNDMFVKGYDRYDAEVNYEALVIAANRGEAGGGTKLAEPLYAVYPSDGLSIASSSLGYVDAGDAKKADIFGKLQEYLLSEDAQKSIQAAGWRTGLGINIDEPDTTVFNPAWGIDTKRTLSAVKLPKTDVIRKAFNLYQTSLRKPSLTVYCLDISGSMGDVAGSSTGIAQLKDAMFTLLDPETSQRYWLQPSTDDVTIVIPFSDSGTYALWKAEGNDPKDLAALFKRVRDLQPGGQTDIYTPVERGYELLGKVTNVDDYAVSVILMTDGESNTGESLTGLRGYIRQSAVKREVPIFSIEFGNANPKQLQDLADLSHGRVFDGRTDLVRAFREAKGYN